VARNHPNKQRGFKEGDIFIEVGGRTDRMDESAFVAFLRKSYKAGSKVPVRLLRKGKRNREFLMIG
jgi:S1-C subfamily serine protease